MGLGNASSHAQKTTVKKSSTGLTIPEPFLLQTAAIQLKTRPEDNDRSPYVPLSVKVKDFEKTPARFKAKPAPVCWPVSRIVFSMPLFTAAAPRQGGAQIDAAQIP